MRRSASRDRRTGFQSRLSRMHAGACVTPLPLAIHRTKDTGACHPKESSRPVHDIRGAEHQIADAVDRKMSVHVNNRGCKQCRRVLIVPAHTSTGKTKPHPRPGRCMDSAHRRLYLISFRSRCPVPFPRPRRVRCCRRCVLFHVRAVLCCRDCVLFRVRAVSPSPNFA